MGGVSLLSGASEQINDNGSTGHLTTPSGELYGHNVGPSGYRFIWRMVIQRWPNVTDQHSVWDGPATALRWLQPYYADDVIA